MAEVTFRFEESENPDLVDDQYVCEQNENFTIQVFQGMYFVNEWKNNIMYDAADPFLTLSAAKNFVTQMVTT